MRRAALTALVLIVALTSLARSLPAASPPLQPRPGKGMFLLFSDIHFDPYTDSATMEKLGAKLLATCKETSSPGFSKMGSDTNYALLKSAMDNVAATAAENHIHYDYVVVTGDILEHHFDASYRECVGGGSDAYEKFSSDTIGFVHAMIASALPGVPVFAALGNNDTDKGDYARPSRAFLKSVGQDWSRDWGNISPAARQNAVESFERAGYFAAPNPSVPKDELVILNSNFWVAHNQEACGEADPDPGGQFQWLEEVLKGLKRERRTATLVMHVLPGVDAMRSSIGEPQSLWTESCTQKFIGELTDFRGVVREIYAGHIHRDDFRIFPDRDGQPLLPIHIVPAISPVYFNNPAVEIGWYDRTSGDLADYAPLYLDIANSKTTWAMEYTFTQAYGRSRPDLAVLVELGREIHAGTPQSGVGKKYADYYAAGVGLFLTPANWMTYTCTQSALTLSLFAQCRSAGTGHKP